MKEGRTKSWCGPIARMVRLNGAIPSTSVIGQPQSSRLENWQWGKWHHQCGWIFKFDIFNTIRLFFPSKLVQVVVPETPSGKYCTCMLCWLHCKWLVRCIKPFTYACYFTLSVKHSVADSPSTVCSSGSVHEWHDFQSKSWANRICCFFHRAVSLHLTSRWSK